VVANDPLFFSFHVKLVELAARYAIPAVYNERVFCRGRWPDELWQQAERCVSRRWHYAGKILQGAKPVELPVMLPTKFELVINLKTAKTLGIAVPPTLYALAHEVIE
jgi:putative ABC transport system substrate-binding protein